MKTRSVKIRHFAIFILISCVMAGTAEIAGAQVLPPAPLPKPVPMPRPKMRNPPSIRSDDLLPKAPEVTAPTTKLKPPGKTKQRRLPLPTETTAELTNIKDEPVAIQKMHQMTVWFVPVVSKLPPRYASSLGIRIQNQMYEMLDDLVTAESYPQKEKVTRLDSVKTRLGVFRRQTWLLLDLGLIGKRDFSHVSELIGDIETELDEWIKEPTPVK